ncbi:MAG: glycosyltransferase family 4 protein [Planctomycetes bacterium]|nr:glycosyltransferase family 4 protein [Planctomycetota bacterium]
MPSRDDAARPPTIAMVDTTLTPYRLHFHRRVVRELRLRLLTWHLRAHDALPWRLSVPDGLQVESFAGAREPGRAAEVVAGRRVLGALRDRRVDAVVVGGYGDLARLMIILGCQRAGTPVLLFGDSNVSGDLARGARRLAKRAVLPLLLRRCSAILACGSRGEDYFSRYGVPSERIFLSPYEPDYDLLARASDEPPESAAARWGLSPARRRLLFVGRLAPEKRVDLAVEGFGRIAGERPEWDLVVAGTGAEGAALKALAARSAPGRVHFVEFVQPARLPSLYRACHALVLPSDYEPWGVVVNEAVAVGLALVCADVVGAAAELLVDGVDGYTFRVGDVDDLVRALRRVTDPSRLESLRAGGAAVLASWRRRADPVVGLGAALARAGVRVQDRTS